MQTLSTVLDVKFCKNKNLINNNNSHNNKTDKVIIGNVLLSNINSHHS